MDMTEEIASAKRAEAAIERVGAVLDRSDNRNGSARPRQDRIPAMDIINALDGAEAAVSECVFCEIIAGNEPATVVADGILNLGIVPLNPVVDGHFLVIPKKHVADAYGDERTTGSAMHDAALWARLFSDRDPRYKSVNIITSVGRPATQSVFHLHLHVVPRAENDGLALPWYTLASGNGSE